MFFSEHPTFVLSIQCEGLCLAVESCDLLAGFVVETCPHNQGVFFLTKLGCNRAKRTLPRAGGRWAPIGCFVLFVCGKRSREGSAKSLVLTILDPLERGCLQEPKSRIVREMPTSMIGGKPLVHTCKRGCLAPALVSAEASTWCLKWRHLQR